MISKSAMKTLTAHHGAPTIVKFTGAADEKIIAHCEKSINDADYLCLALNGLELAVFDLTATLPNPVGAR